jgi:hypothetical protein
MPQSDASDTCGSNMVFFAHGALRTRMCRHCGGLGLEYGCAWVRMEVKDLRRFRRLLAIAKRSAESSSEPVFIGWDGNGSGLCLEPSQAHELAEAVEHLISWVSTQQLPLAATPADELNTSMVVH